MALDENKRKAIDLAIKQIDKALAKAPSCDLAKNPWKRSIRLARAH